MNLENIGYYLASWNAFLNGLSAVCILMGYRSIRQKNEKGHKKWMITAFCVSMLFLVSYLTRFYLTGVHRFPGSGLLKTAYLCLLTSHTLLAAITPILVIRAIVLGLKNQREKHVRLVKWAFPIWLYVSVTGVIVYLILYHLN